MERSSFRRSCAWRAGRGGVIVAVPVEQRSAELSAVGEYPGVELDVVDGAAVVEDVSGFEAAARVYDAEIAEQAVPRGAEEVGPFVGAARAVGAEALEEAGAEKFDEAAAGGLDGLVGPPELMDLVGGEEVVAPDVADDREVALAQRAGLGVVAALALDDGAVVAVN
jgi:hypothetical protein